MKRVIEDSILNDIAKAIQEKNGTDTKYEDVEMAQAVRDISTTKEEQEKTVNVTENGVTEILPDDNKVLSKVTVDVNVADSYYDTFWDVWQNNGNRTDYREAFRNEHWNEKNFYPKYDIKPNFTQNMFVTSHIKIDLRERLKECGVMFDFSKVTDRCNYTFSSSYFEALPILDFTNCPVDLYPQFSDCLYLHTIEKVILTREHTYGSSGGLFSKCSALENVTIEGEIGNSISISAASKLTSESAKSFLTHLVNYAGTENEFVHSISFHSNVWDLLDAEGETAPGGVTWRMYVSNIGWNP